MADNSTLQTSLETALNAQIEGGVQSYSIAGRSVQMLPLLDQYRLLKMLRGDAARANGGICRVAKFQEPRT